MAGLQSGEVSISTWSSRCNGDGHADILSKRSSGQVRSGNERGNPIGVDKLRVSRGLSQPRAGLASYRNGRLQRRRLLRHSSSKHERPSLDLGHERKHDSRRRARQPQSRAELACGRADLTGLPVGVRVLEQRALEAGGPSDGDMCCGSRLERQTGPENLPRSPAHASHV